MRPLTGPGAGRGAGDDVATRIWVTDRVEGEFAVLVADDDETRLDVPLARLPAPLREGTVLRVPQSGGEPRWEGGTVDEELRRARLEEAEAALNRLRHRDPGGDISL